MSDLTISGNLTTDPELRFTSGQPVATFRIASTPRFYNKQAANGRTGTRCS
jgi:single-strand DNA-binding protein